MHCAWAISEAFILDVIGGFPCGERAAPNSPRQELTAAWKAGDCVLIVEGIAIPANVLSAVPEEAPGSGKPDTPWARMHFENASWAPADNDPVAVLWELPPHPAERAHAATTPIIETVARLKKVLCRWLCVMSSPELVIVPTFYGIPGFADVSPQLMLVT